jgi:hypothetical protein
LKEEAMRRVGFVLGAVVVLLGALVPALAQQPFADVPLDHWAYNAVNKLAETGLIEGYPDGTFKGKQPLTRYEFAQAIARMMERMEQMKGIPGPKGEPGPPGPAGGGGGVTAEQQALLDRLAKEFAPELKALRSDLDNLTKRVEELEARPAAKGPTITVSGDIDVRTGLYGTKLGTQEVESTGYPFSPEGTGGGGGADAPLTVAGGAFLGSVAPYGGINLPDFVNGAWTDVGTNPSFVGTIPISDALKDTFKASDFLTQRTRINLAGQLSDTTSVKVQLLADTRTNNIGNVAQVDYTPEEFVGSPNALSGNGIMDEVKINEAWVAHKTHFLVPMDMVVGKQYVRRGEGLLVDNDQEATKGFRFDWNKEQRVSWGIYWGLLDREEFYGRSTGDLGLPGITPLIVGGVGMYSGSELNAPQTNGQDNYNLYYADFALSKSWDLGVNWLQSGFNKEQAWSASLDGKFFGLGFYGEFSQLRKWPTGLKFFDANGDGVQDASELTVEQAGRNAWFTGLKWDNDWLALTGEYGLIDPGYAFSPGGCGWSQVGPFMGGSDLFTFNLPLSALHPLAEVNAHYINWVDRPLFLDPTNIAKGWHFNATFPKLLGPKTPVSISYASGDGYNPRFLSWMLFSGVDSAGAPITKPDKWERADPVWWVQLSHQLSDSVTAKLLYGRREADRMLSGQRVPVITTPDQVQHFAINDAVQVVRAELAVEF